MKSGTASLKSSICQNRRVEFFWFFRTVIEVHMDQESLPLQLIQTTQQMITQQNIEGRLCLWCAHFFGSIRRTILLIFISELPLSFFHPLLDFIA